MKIENSLLQIRDKLLAGKASFETDDENVLYTDFTNALKTITDENLFNETPDLSEIVCGIFDESVNAQLSKNLMAFMPVDIFFLFGEYLNRQNSAFNKNLIHSYLDNFRYSRFLNKIYDDGRWGKLVEELIRKSNFNFNVLFTRHTKEYQGKTLFKVITNQTTTDYSWSECNKIIKKYSSAFINILSEVDAPDSMVSFLLENDLDTALLDLACLTSGIVNVMIPANSVSQHIEFILNQTKSPVVVVFDDKQLVKIKSVRKELKYLKKIILLKGTSTDDMVVTFKDFVDGSKHIEPEFLSTYKINRSIDDLASIMYTSGTTGEPKGIMFSNMNIVYKRFCRAMAIPAIGDEDRFLAYLPLYHTFGRWLEMTGTIFWGAEYAFMENPSIESMLLNMQLVKPTIFISIPKKWNQVYEAITNRVDIEVDDEQKIYETVLELTGGHLRWGLSAAGFLPPDVFKFFQRYKIELMSGFGMTEATGGITMTPPNKYIPNSLGKELPGIEIKIADDGELWIRGAYVMLGYFDQKYEETFLEGGWVPTGDVMKIDEQGFIEIIDRKKEIYKNVKGETITPQRIENFFRDFENVKQVFLAGDHRPFNTVLIFPNFETENNLLKRMTNEQKQSYFSSLIVTVNNFLAPFERIVDFRIIDRAFSEELGELTPKGTFKRRNIEKNFEVLIEQMYAKDHTSLYIEEIEIRIPNWFLREQGCLSGDIIKYEEGITLPKLNRNLIISVQQSDRSLVFIGDFIYRMQTYYIDFQTLLINPLFWIGNKGLLNFTGEGIFQWYRQHSGEEKLSFYAPTGEIINSNNEKELLAEFLGKKEYSMTGLNTAILLLQSHLPEETKIAIKYLQLLLEVETLAVSKIALSILYRPAMSSDINVRREMFISCLKIVNGNSFKELLELYLEYDYDLLNEIVITSI
ncbi:MAG: AMP-binding protein, partial [Ignavibacteriaceae bacterium]|nr:AMP-binding protein [Ignavibacteriaceae bacterium]